MCQEDTVLAIQKLFLHEQQNGMYVLAEVMKTDPEAGLFSAACRARMLAEQGGTLS